jgi:WD40 repeat protein
MWWDVDAPRTPRVLRHPDDVYDGALNHDGTLAWTVSRDAIARRWDMSAKNVSAKEIPFGSPGWLHTVALSPDERQIVVTNDNGRAILFRADGSDPRPLRAVAELAHVGPIMLTVFSTDGKHLLTCGAMDGAARIWDVGGRARPDTLGGHTGAITVCGFTDHDARAFTATEDGVVRLWTSGWPELIARTAARTTATLTIDQRMNVLGETADNARRNYETAERRLHRIPLSPDWTFAYPSF